MPVLKSHRNRLALGAIIALAACGGDATSSEPTLELVRVEGNSQQVYPNRTLPVAPAVRVVREGKPVAGVTVVFTVTSGGGSGGGTAVTDENGVARSGAWTLGGEIGEQRMVARLADDDRVTALFSAYAVEVTGAQLFWNARVGQPFHAEAGSEGRYGPVIQVLALDGTPLPGEIVRWSTDLPTRAVVSIADTRTDAQGRAQLHSVIYPGPVGPVVITAEVLRDNIIPRSAQWAYVVEAGPVFSVTVIGGANQSAPAGSTLPVVIRLAAEDRFGNAVKGHGNVSVVEGGGSVAGPEADSGTGFEWIVPAWTLGPTPGRNVIRVRVGAVDVDIEATGT